MSDTSAIVLVIAIGVIFMAGCVIACVFIGRHYARKCARSADYCYTAYERIDFVVEEIERQYGHPTDVLPPAPAHLESPPLTRGQRARANGRQAPTNTHTRSNQRHPRPHDAN